MCGDGDEPCNWCETRKELKSRMDSEGVLVLEYWKFCLELAAGSHEGEL